jgi:hypothetical protein
MPDSQTEKENGSIDSQSTEPFETEISASDTQQLSAPSIQEQARLCRAAGLRIMPISMPSKTPAVPKGFYGRELPNATAEPEDFHDGQQVGILCGNTEHEGLDLLGLDRDGNMTWEQVEQALGFALPPTLSNKGDRHRFYGLPAGHGLRQANGILRCPGGQLDTRPDHGGYLRSPWEWDDGFDVARIADFPDVEALRALRPPQSERARKERPPSEKQLSENDAEIVRRLASVWQKGTTGDAAFGGMGGVLYRAGVSVERAEAMAEALADAVASTHTNPVGRVLQAFEGKHDLGWRTLSDALCENGVGFPDMPDGQLMVKGNVIYVPSLMRPEVRIVSALGHVEQLIDASVDEPPEVAEATHELEPDANLEDDEPQEREPEQPQTIDEACALLFRPVSELPKPKPLDYVCEGLLIARDVRPASIVCYPGVGKTTAGVEIARAVSTGTPAFGQFPCKKGRVLYLANEGGRGVHDALLQHAPDVVLVRDTLLFSGDEATVNASKLILAKAAKEFDLIILDSLNSSLPGLDENDARSAEPLGDFEKLLASENGGKAAMVVLRHTGKTKQGHKDPMQAGRGTSAIDGRVSVQWLLEPIGDLGVDRSVDWQCTRANDTDRAPARPFNVALRGSVFEVSQETGKQTATKQRAAAKESEKESDVQRARAAIQDAWWTGGYREISQRDAEQIALSKGLPGKVGRRALHQLVVEGANPATRGTEYAYRLSEKGPARWGVNPSDKN